MKPRSTFLALAFLVASSMTGGCASETASAADDVAQEEAALTATTGFVRTDSGDIFVEVRPGAANQTPFVYLSGIASRAGASAEDPFLDRLRTAGVPVIKIILPGQGETLRRDIENTGARSIDHDVDAREQVTAVLDTLRALQITKPVNLGGMSYGGAIALAAEKLAGDKFARVLLLAPEAVSSRDRSNDWMRINPFFAPTWWATALGTVRSAFPEPPPVLANHEDDFHMGILRLFLGLESFDFAGAMRGREKIYVLSVPGDSLAPPHHMKELVDTTENGVLTVVPENVHAEHFVTGSAPEFSAKWVLDVLAGRLD